MAFDRSDSALFDGVIQGPGGLTQIGTGVLRLSGINSYTATTTITAGTLQLGNNDTTGAIAAASNVTIATGSTLALVWANDHTLANLISGSGNLNQSGASILTLTANNTLSGTTAIAPGSSLQLGNGATSGLVDGPIVDSGRLLLNRSDSFTLASQISGAGALVQNGTGTSILTANQTYTGNYHGQCRNTANWQWRNHRQHR